MDPSINPVFERRKAPRTVKGTRMNSATMPRQANRVPESGVKEYIKIFPLTLGVFLFSLAVGGIVSFAQENGSQSAREKRAEIERQLEELEEEAAVFDAELQETRTETRSLANEVKVFDAQIGRRELEIKRLTLAARQASLDIDTASGGIDTLSRKIDAARDSLATSLFILYLYDEENALTTFLKNKSLSTFFDTIDSLKKVQGTIRETLFGFREDRIALEQEKVDLQQYREEQQDLRALQEIERRLIEQKKSEKDELLRLTKGKEYLFQQLLQAKKKDIATLRTQLFYLEKTGITVEDAIRFAELAAGRTGIRTAFLLALLEVETGKQFEEGVISVGSNLGTGNWNDDMYLCYQRLGRYYGGSSVAKYDNRAEREKNAFFKITDELGLDPNKMPVSKEPPYIGCGGAMGPAQFIPSTWLIFRDRVADLTGHNPPSPWDVEDAFTAAAIFLADSGADLQNDYGETRAAKTYISGSPSCSRTVCRSYASRILSLARDIDRVL